MMDVDVLKHGGGTWSVTTRMARWSAKTYPALMMGALVFSTKVIDRLGRYPLGATELIVYIYTFAIPSQRSGQRQYIV